jgi:hypothetical protein
VYKAVRDGVGQGRIANDVVPVIHGQLAGHDGRTVAVTVVEQLQKIPALLGGEFGEAPIASRRSSPNPLPTFSGCR